MTRKERPRERGEPRESPADSVVGSSRDHLLPARLEYNRVLELRCVPALDVAEWRIRVHEPKLAHVAQAHMLLASGVLG